MEVVQCRCLVLFRVVSRWLNRCRLRLTFVLRALTVLVTCFRVRHSFVSLQKTGILQLQRLVRHTFLVVVTV